MSTNSQDQEIDLGQLSKKIGGFFNNLSNSFFEFIFFIKRKLFILILLFAVGVALAYLADGKKKYKHEISVIPNFKSNDFLYERIEEINFKIREQDSTFFKNLGINNFEDVLSIKIEALPTIYNFINYSDQENNFELIKLMAEDGDINKILIDDITSKNYYHHKISIKTKGTWNRKSLIDPILRYLNDNEYFKDQQKINLKNVEDKIIANDSLIKQIDHIISLLSTDSNGVSSISISKNNSIRDLIDKKDFLISESQNLKSVKLIYSNIVKEESSIMNVRVYVPLILNSKIVFPIILIILYLLCYIFNKKIKKYKLEIKDKE
ncbi:hypothetical protein ACFO3U_00265 [Flavobacterium ponti]|uniref:Polysaccharide chain length determinant N-terminal domain-containing protein n=1 Tax=Flavobacterium ponti TaxID=665133 RepID=A0ABV9NYJ2_9FLAO